MHRFHPHNFVVGILVGSVLTLLIVWIAYFGRVSVFSHCPNLPRPCLGDDYYNDPGDALKNDPSLKATDVLSIDDNNKIHYDRVQKTGDCVPRDDAIVYLKYPQYCSLTSTGGTEETYRQTLFGSNNYVPVAGTGDMVITAGDCVPLGSSSFVRGVPLLRLDPEDTSMTSRS